MYSHEIEELLKIRKYILSSEEYIKLCNTSSQIQSITYKPSEDRFYIYTKDNYNFDFKVELTKQK